MKWIYGKQDWKTLERGQENCWLMTNGLGGFSSLTMGGSVSRNDHALLMGCLKAPNCRYNFVHRLSELVKVEKNEYVISSQEFADGTSENGYEYLEEFAYEDTPVWRFLVRGVQIRKEAVMKQKSNTVAVCYEISNRSRSRCTLSVTPFFPNLDVPKSSSFGPKNSAVTLSLAMDMTSTAIVSPAFPIISPLDVIS